MPTVEILDDSKPVYIDEAKKVKHYFEIAITKGQKTNEGPLRIKLGDLIAVSVDTHSGARPCPRQERKHMSNRWFPFSGPWSSGQVVGIYQKMDDINQWTIMLRWFYRTTEYDIQSLPKVQDHNDDLEDIRLLLKDYDEIYECDDVGEIEPDSVLDHIYIHNNTRSRNFVRENKQSLSYCCRRFLSFDNDKVLMHAIKLNGESPSWEHERELTAFELGRVQNERNLMMLRRVVRGLRCVPLWRDNESACFNAIRHVCTSFKNLSYHEIEMQESLYYSSSDEMNEEEEEETLNSQPLTKYVEKQKRMYKQLKSKKQKPKKAKTKVKVKIKKNIVPKQQANSAKKLEISTQTSPAIKQKTVFIEPLQQKKRKAYYSSIHLPSKKGPTWNVELGEAVCIDCPEYFNTRSKQYKNHWYPFDRAWRPAQVIAIYHNCNDEHDRLSGNIPLDQLYVEIRWLYRPSDTAREIAKELEHTAQKSALEEVYETEFLEVVQAIRVVGKIVLLGNKSQNENSSANAKESCSAPVLKHLCQKFYAHKEKVLFDLPFQGRKSSIERGLKLSERFGILCNRQHAITELYKAAGIKTTEPVSDSDKDNMCQGFRKLQFTTTLRKKDDSILCNLEYFSYASAPISWSNYHLADVVCNQSDRNRSWKWIFSVGDYVALCSDSSNKPENSIAVEKAGGQIWYPFNVAWSACQILSIYRYKEDDHNDLKIRIRWLYRSTDFVEAKCPNTKGWRHDTIYTTDHLDEVSFESILGPIDLTFQHEKYRSGEYSTVPDTIRNNLSISLRCFSTDYYVKTNRWRSNKNKGKENSRFIDHFATAMQRAGFSSNTEPSIKEYTDWLDDEKKTMNESLKGNDNVYVEKRIDIFRQYADAFGMEIKSHDENQVLNEEKFVNEAFVNEYRYNCQEETDELEVLVSFSPFHVNVSAQKAYFSEVSILPPYENYTDIYKTWRKCYEKNYNGKSKNSDIWWKICLGDIVAVHSNLLENKSGGRSNTNSQFPFVVDWWAGEVVSIWQNVPSLEEAQNLRKKSEISSKHNEKEEVNSLRGVFCLEIRWFYRTTDIPGATGLNKTGSTSTLTLNDELEEVLETDEIHEIGLKSLLAPVILLSESKSEDSELSHIQNINGMPVVRFNCFRFWSIHRKTLVPIGQSEKRWERGIGYSKHLDKNSIAKAALNDRTKRIFKSKDNGTIQVNSKQLKQLDWKSTFHKVISKLTLTDASADAQMHGIVLTGREKEQNIISKFLRSAILSVNNQKNNQYENFSLFVAGPPGTGKTASVNSIISRLRKEQSEGNLPVFDFVSLNGMEMRHPFDAYVRLWEAISGNKEKKSPGIAAGKLEKMFTGTVSPKEKNSQEPNLKRNAVVVLLDEIDYLVTARQTVLYNFFDWPIRATKGNSSAQLIVIGISNTLNLPEQLNPSVQSRLGMDRCIFGAYNEEESIQILKSRLEVVNESSNSNIRVFEPDAIKFAAKKIAAISGDIRKAFQLCKAAAETVYSELEKGKREPNEKGCIGIKDVQKASREMFSTIIHKAVSFATAFEALLLVCVASLKRQSGRSEGGFNINDVMVKMDGVACAFGDQRYLPVPTFGELLGILNRLGEAKVISLQSANGTNGFYGVSGAENTLISLQLEDYEIIGALKDTVHCKLAENYLTGSRF